MAKVLVVGGAGYVGGTAVARLLDLGHEPWVLDDLSTGYRDLAIAPGFTHARAGDTDAVRRLLSENEFDCVMHFAARALVGESVRKPDEYFENNVVQTERLIEALLESGKPGHRRFIFSSTCAIFGDPGVTVIDESCPKKPINPYGESKLAAEKLMERLARDRGLQAIALRYFNAAGADPKLRVGEMHSPETHLIPRVIQAILRDEPVEIYGTDYETEDGTCIRDYVHVMDLADAHVAAMERLIGMPAGPKGRFEGFNLGSENGSSVLDVIEATAEELGKKVHVIERPRRAGDPPLLVADSALARKVLGFSPKRALAEILKDAVAWEKKKKGVRRRAVFLDRDGTLNEDPGYLNDPEKVILLPSVPEALAAMKCAGFVPVVVSNQSGINRGLVDPKNLEAIHDRINALLRPAGAVIQEIYYCVHHPDEKCTCRKPEPGLLLKAAQDLNVDIARSYMIGDKLSDVEVGGRAGVKGTILVRTGCGRETEEKLRPGQAAFIADSLADAVNWILTRENAGH